ncbi:MAG: helix-turn-helix protein, CopG [uncultured bacterium]|nr:MAG: helix-turn-helix protein, CopG [uncultured bacterium]
MKKKRLNNNIIYMDEPIKMGKLVGDFLPKPEHLVFHDKKRRVTLTLSEESLDFFKSAAKKHGASYQAMIRRLIDYYVANQKTA